MKRRIAHLGFVYFFVDLLAIVAAYYSTLVVRFNSSWGDRIFTWINRTLDIRDTGTIGGSYETFYIVSAPRIILILTLTLTVLYALHDLYAERRFIKRRPVTWHVILCNVMALAFFYAYFYLQRNAFHPRSLFVTVLFVNTIYCVLFRGVLDRLLRRQRLASGFDVRPVVLVGEGRNADRIAEMIAEMPAASLRVCERLAVDPAGPDEAWKTRIRAAVEAHGADMVVLADVRFSVAQIMLLLEMADELDLAIKVLSHELDVLLSRARIDGDMVNGIPLVHFEAPSHAQGFQGLKRLVSLVGATAAVLVASPLLLAVGLLVRLTSRGPALFVQERIGVNHRTFRMYKFRTMRHLADDELKKLEAQNQAGAGGLFKIRKDPRITSVGGFLRRYSIDELPQLFNVVQGDMTLVGPRPLPRRDYENYYEDWHYGRHNGLPGLTCLWQVSGRSDLDFHSMCILDVYYLRNQNWVLDLHILLRTVWVVLFAKGAY